MSPAPPIDPPVPPRRSRWGVLLGIGVIAAVLAYLALSGMSNALVYYRTPTELLDLGESAIGQSVRLGGLVKPGSVHGPATDLTFVLTDGTNEVTVHSSVAPTTSFREGIGAVVEGEMTTAGVFEATQVIVKHDENYVAPSEGQLPSQVIDPGT
ncbi:MAG TPA: cytochrome c maturation protein CcmE [Candidatus Limnocylindria bacterium]